MADLVPDSRRVATCCGANSFPEEESSLSAEELDKRYPEEWVLLSRTVLPRTSPLVKEIRGKRPKNWALIKTSKGFIPFRGWSWKLPEGVEIKETPPIWSAPHPGVVKKLGDLTTIEGTHGLRSKENIEKGIRPGVNVVIIALGYAGGKIPSEYEHLKAFGFRFIPLIHKAWRGSWGTDRKILLGVYEKKD